MPSSDLDVKDIVVKWSDVLEVLFKLPLELKEVFLVLWTFDTTEYGHHLLLTFSGELELTLADFNKILASLDESFILSEDGFIAFKFPSWSWRVLFDHLLLLEADSLPFLAAVNALFKILHALLDVTIKHIVLVDFNSASLNDLIRDFGQQALHSLRSMVVFTELPNDSDAIQGLWEDLGDVFWFSLLDLSAWVR